MIHQTDQFRGNDDGIVEHPVEHIFDRPGQLTNGGRLHHATTAFQGVEGAAYGGHGFFIALIGFELRPEFVQGFGNFFGFFEEDFDDFIVDQIIIVVCRSHNRSGRRDNGRL